ncbi:MBL fold metallo-hydrolase [Paenibacillus beijingensis]|uniref:Metallo-beta-lactamase domain-containing protein n=1 Tax=Paenibacillus beijingensis TaxID=1126833 RepID=A0A0D5NFA8_9BACL|nr:MBL fold metallo-hydrolase [Paenibacillus beijingensis]AJY73825.1 hypothetical protein VN24_03240 [Paenibacillus beijingensis]
MKITKHLTVSQLAFLPNVFPVNCYFVEEVEGLTLIDAALPSSASSIIDAAQKIGKPITRIVLTHAHDDHVGSLDRLKQELPAVKVYISFRDSILLAGERTLQPGEPQTPIRGGVPTKVKTKPDVLLRDGEQIGSLLALSVPGHTPGSMAFFDTRNGALIAGDAFQTRGGVAVTGQLKPLFPFPAMATWNKELALESARKLRELSPSLLATGHGRMIESPAAIIDQAIQNAEKNLQKKKQVV